MISFSNEVARLCSAVDGVDALEVMRGVHEASYFTVRDAARLVGLPDDYLFPRSWSESMRQLGNAVPAQLGEAAGGWLKDLIFAGRSN